MSGDTVLVLRVSRADGRSKNGFQWPEAGPVACDDWHPAPVCGRGLHGLLWGEGDSRHLALWGAAADVRWQVVEVEASKIVQVTEDGGGKVKFPSGVVVFSAIGDYVGATALIASRAPKGSRIHRGTSTSGDGGTSTSGDGGTSTSGDRGTSTSGDGGTSTSGDGGTSTSGYGGTSTSGYGGTSTSGDGGTSTSGDGGTSTSGDRGTVICKWRDASYRLRQIVGYVGEDGIKPNTPYRAVDGKLVEVAK